MYIINHTFNGHNFRYFFSNTILTNNNDNRNVVIKNLTTHTF